MSRLVAFGCSYTYGHGLEDCVDEDMRAGPQPSRFAWPQLLANSLNLKCVNQGEPGSSNKQIWYRLVNYEFHPTDRVFILWSTNGRHCVIQEDNQVDPIGHWVTTKSSRMYYKHLYTEQDQAIDSKLRIEHASYHLSAKHIEHYNLLFRKDTVQAPSSARILNTDFRTIKHGRPRAVDQLHPGKQAHQAFAVEILKEIN